MTTPNTLDGVLVQWGDRLFYPSNRSTKTCTPALTSSPLHQRAQALRQRIHATVVRRAPQVMVKVTGGGRGMAAIVACSFSGAMEERPLSAQMRLNKPLSRPNASLTNSRIARSG
jgi:hypothetical protein